MVKYMLKAKLNKRVGIKNEIEKCLYRTKILLLTHKK